MPLNKSTLQSALENVLTRKPSLADAARGWARAYADYAGGAMSAASSLPTNAAAGAGPLESAFTAAFQARNPMAAAATITNGVISFWMSIVWVGAAATGTTVVPGNPALAAGLAQIFADNGEVSEADKAAAFADAFDAGAKQVMVLDIPNAQPAPPISGPIT